MLYLPKTKQLQELASYLGISSDDLINSIDLGFKKTEYELYDNEDAGKPLGEILNSMNINPVVFACFYLKRSDTYIVEMLSNLYYKNSLDDCPYCGCETSTLFDWNDSGRGSETKVCSNCSYSSEYVTNWDALEKGFDY